MNKYIRTTKFLRKIVVSTPLNSIAFNEDSKYAKLCLDGTKNLFAIHNSSVRPYNMLLTKKTTKSGKNQKFSRKVPEERVKAI